MKRISLLLSVLVICFVASTQAQTAAPKPSPELKKLQVWLGHWRGVFEYQPGPGEPSRKLSLEETFEMILGGFFMQDRVTGGTNPDLWIIGYDPAKKNYPTISYSGTDGAISSFTLTVDGNTWTLVSNGPLLYGGKNHLYRATITFSADSMSRQEKGEISEDGKTWTPMSEYKATKVKPAAKK